MQLFLTNPVEAGHSSSNGASLTIQYTSVRLLNRASSIGDNHGQKATHSFTTNTLGVISQVLRVLRPLGVAVIMCRSDADGRTIYMVFCDAWQMKAVNCRQ